MSSEQRYLYRYRSLASGAAAFVGRIVRENELYFANPSSFNDPFDCRPSFSMDAPKAQLRRYYQGIYSRQAPLMSRAVRRDESKKIARDPARNPANPQNLLAFKETYHANVTATIGLLCLSEIANDLLMWSHYADSHRGVCLVFDWHTEFFGQAQAVIYQKSRPRINPVFQSHEEMLNHALLTKSNHWQYEKEWRIIHYRKGAGAYKFPAPSLVGIVLGAQISRENRAMIIGWLDSRASTVTLFQASLSDIEFAVDIAPCLP